MGERLVGEFHSILSVEMRCIIFATIVLKIKMKKVMYL